MSTAWNCSNCHLTNSLQNIYCQACFTHMPINISYKTDETDENSASESNIQIEEETEDFDINFEVISNENKMDDMNTHNDESFSDTEDMSMEYTTPTTQINDESSHTLSLSDINNSPILSSTTLLPSTTLLGANGTTPKHNNKFDSKSSVNPDIISKLMTRQRMLFDGFLRSASICDIDYKYDIENDIMLIPSDIINLSFAFFELNITKICQKIHSERTAIYSIQMRLDTDNENGLKEIDEIISYDDLYELAMILRGERDCFIAYELMSELIDKKPDMSEYHNAMGLILKRWNCFDLAEICYKKAIAGEPKENIYKWNFGLLLEERMKYKLALEQFLSASSNCDEKEPDYIFEAAYCYQKLNDYNNATINYLKAIEMDNNKSTYWIYYAEYLCEELKQYDESTKCFQKAIQLEDENNINYYYRFARYLRDFHQNYHLSKMYYLKCLNMNKTKDKNGKLMEIQGVNGSFGYLLFLMGEYDTSNQYLSLAQITDPQNAWTFFYYGLLHISYFKNEKKAYELLHKAIECCTTKYSFQKHLDRIKNVDANNIEYHNKFESLLNEKFHA